MKICFFIGNLGSGGAERTVQYLSKYGVDNGYDIDVVTLTDIKFYDLHEKVNYYPLDFYKKTKNPFYRFFHAVKRIRGFRKYIKSKKPDILFVVLHPAIVYTYFTQKKYFLIGSERSNPNFYVNKLKIKVRDMCFKHCDDMIYQTNAAAKYYKDKLGLDGVVIPNAVGNAIAYEFDKPCENRTKKFVAMGRLSLEKDYITMMKAFDFFYKNHKDYTLEIFGDGEQREFLKDFSDKLEAKDAIKFMGADKCALRKIYDATGYLLTSTSEGMPNALMEAMAIGLPCISTDCPNGPSDLIVDGENGVLVKMGDVEAIAEQMEKIVIDKEYADKLSQNAIKIKDTHSIEKNSEKFYDFFKECLNSKKG